MIMKIRKFGVVLGALAAMATASGVAAGAASADSIISASTHVSNHPDTTSASGGACNSNITPNGPVWALDRYKSRLTAVNTGPDTWTVTIRDRGSFAGFADPVTCAPLVSRGSLVGTYSVTVTTAGTPSRRTLHHVYSGDISTTTMVQDFFGDPSASVVGGDYFFSYQGGNYVQDTSGSSGDVTAHH